MIVFNRNGSYFRFFIACLAIIAIMSCRKNDVGATLPEPKDSVQRINRWILDSMLKYYLYSDGYTSYPSLSEKPEVFFDRLLDPRDRFSWISNGVNIGPAANAFDRYGFHYILIQLSDYSAAYWMGIVTFSVHDSPAARAGFHRGTCFTRINGSLITAGNKEQLIAQMNNNSSLKLTTADKTGGAWQETGSKTMTPAYFEERPVYTTRVFKTQQTAVGYIFYNGFKDFFDKDILEALDKLKAAQVSDLILDLRYNPGGSVASAAKIATAISNGIAQDDLFARYKGNSRQGIKTQSFAAAIESSSNSYRKNFNDLVAAGLQLNRVYILSTAATASAAEMMINNLRPYLQVIHIGERTLGKDKAGMIIRDMRQPREIQWFLQPMLFSVFNADSKGDYSNGLTPDYTINEFEQLPLPGIGEADDALIHKALSLILGNSTVDTEILRKKKVVTARFGKEDVRYNSVTVINGSGATMNIQQ